MSSARAVSEGMKALDHLHIFERWQIKPGQPRKAFGEMQYRCTHPDCYCVKPVSLLLGKKAICALCKEREVILDRDQLKRVQPRCPRCSQTKEAIRRRDLAQKLEKMLEPGDFA